MCTKALTLALVTALTACATATDPKHQISADYVGPQLAPFDLVCKSKSPGQADLIFHVVRADDGAALVNKMNDKPLLEFRTHTYMNAYMWTDGKETYEVDRMSGVLSVKPSGVLYDCERRGIQRF